MAGLITTFTPVFSCSEGNTNMLMEEKPKAYYVFRYKGVKIE